jgi:hypothetical protein
MMPLKGFRDEKQIQDFRRIMGKDKAIDTQASEYSSLWRRQTQGAGSQGNGRYSFRIANRLSMERIERNGYLFQQYGSFTISGVDKNRSFSETLENSTERL